MQEIKRKNKRRKNRVKRNHRIIDRRKKAAEQIKEEYSIRTDKRSNSVRVKT